MRWGPLTYAVLMVLLAGLLPAGAADPLSRNDPEGAQFSGPVPIGKDGRFKDTTWTENPEVEMKTEEPVRSSMVGDIFVWDGQKFVVAPVGFNSL